MRATKVAPSRPSIQPSTTRLVLPKENERNVPPTELTSYAICIHGAKGIGKSTLAAEFPGNVTFMFEPLRVNLPVRMVQMNYASPAEIREGKDDPYIQFADLVNQALEDDSVECITVDGTDLYYRSVLSSYCAYQGVDHPQALNDFGKSWDAIDDLFNAPLHAIRRARKGLIFTCHTTIKDVETVEGTVVEMVNPALTGRALKIIKELCDIVFFYGPCSGTRGAIRVRDFDGRIWCSAGVSGKFMQPNGKPLQMFAIPDNSSDPTVGYETITKAFNNQLWDLNATEEEKGGTETKKTKLVRR